MKYQPCKNCTERHIACHSECGKYREWQTMHQERKDKIEKAKQLECELKGYYAARQKRIYKNTKNNHEKGRVAYGQY